MQLLFIATLVASTFSTPLPLNPGKNVSFEPKARPLLRMSPVLIEAKEYVLGEKNSIDCPPGSSPLPDAASCKAYAVASDTDWGMARLMAQSYPSGCFLYQQMHLKEVNFNLNTTSVPNPYISKICQPDTCADFIADQGDGCGITMEPNPDMSGSFEPLTIGNCCQPRDTCADFIADQGDGCGVTMEPNPDMSGSFDAHHYNCCKPRGTLWKNVGTGYCNSAAGGQPPNLSKNLVTLASCQTECKQMPKCVAVGYYGPKSRCALWLDQNEKESKGGWESYGGENWVVGQDITRGNNAAGWACYNLASAALVEKWEDGEECC